MVQDGMIWDLTMAFDDTVLNEMKQYMTKWEE